MADITPEFIKEWIARSRTLFGISGVEYCFHIKMTDKPNGSPSSAGACTSNARYLIVDLEFQPDLEENQHGAAIVTHEVGHAAMMEIDDMVEMILQNVPHKDENFFRELYRDATERFLQRLSRSFVYNFDMEVLENTKKKR